MQNIFIVFLADADQATYSFQGIKRDIEKNFNGQAIYSTDLSAIDIFLLGYNTDNQPMTVTVLSHGAPEGISTMQAEDDWIRLSYSQLLPLIARCRTTYPLILNLTAPCYSYLVLDFIKHHNIDEVWYTTGESNSLHKSLAAATHGFDELEANDEQDLYRRYKRS